MVTLPGTDSAQEQDINAPAVRQPEKQDTPTLDPAPVQEPLTAEPPAEAQTMAPPPPPEPVTAAPAEDAAPKDIGYEGIIEQRNMYYNRDLRHSLAQSMTADRTRAARAAQLAHKTGLPPDMVEPRLKEIEADMGLHDINIDKVQSDYPALAMFLSDQWAARLASDEIPLWQRVTDTMGGLAGGVVGPVVGGTLRGAGETLTAFEGVRQEGMTRARAANPNMPRTAAELLGMPAFDPVDAVAGTMVRATAGILTPVGEVIQNIGENMAPPPERATLASDAAGGVGQTIANIGITALAPYASLALLAGQGASQQVDMMEGEAARIDGYMAYLDGEATRLESLGSPESQAIRNQIADLQARRDNLDDPETRLAALLYGGAITGATERVQAGVLLNKIPGLREAMAGIDSLPAPLKSAAARYMAGITAAGAGEAVQEVIEGFGQDVVAQAFYNPDVNFFEGWEQDAAVGGISGAIAQAGVFYLQSLGRGGRVARRAYDESQTITGTAAIIDDLQELVQTSKLQERDPVMAKRLLDMIGEDINRPVFLSAEAAQVFYQDGVDPTALLETDPELAAELNRARITGEDVEIPVHRLVGLLAAGQGQYDIIKPYIKDRADGMDLGTAQKIQSDPEAINQWLRDAMDAEREQMAGMERDAAALTKSESVERTIYQGLLNSELPRVSSPVTARQYAGLMRRMYETVSERLDGNEDMIRRLDERMARLTVRGPARTLNIKPDQLDLTLEKMRDIRRGKNKRRKVADYPMRNYLTKRGGVTSASPEGQEIRFMGFEAPRLLRKKGAPIDNIPVADLAETLGIDPANIPADATGLYADRQFIYDALRAEAGGEPLVRSDEDRKRVEEDAMLDDMDRVLSELGLDVERDSNAKIKVALEAERQRLGALADEGVFYQTDLDDKPLIAMHNIRAAGLKNADKIGGLPVPSLAITRADIPYDNFGDISLIAPASMIDPQTDKAAKVFDADVYSPRYPRASYVLKDKAWNEMVAEVRDALPQEAGKIQDFMEYDRVTDRGPDGLSQNGGMALLWLRQNNAEIPATQKMSNGQPYGPGNARDYVRAAEQIEGYEQFIQDRFDQIIDKEVIFDGFTNSGRRRYLPHNLDTVVKVMKRSLKDGEGFNYGIPSIRATLAKKFRSLKAIKADSDRLITAEQMQAVKDEIAKDFDTLWEKFASKLQYKPSFGAMDNFSEHLKELGETRRTTVLDQYYNDLTAEDKQAALDFLDKLRNLPTQYFEVKMQRAVALNEFRGAVVSDDVDAATLKVLEFNRIPYKTFKKGNAEDRARVVQEFAAELNQAGPESDRVLFQDQPATTRLPTLKDLVSYVSGKGNGLKVIAGRENNSSYDPLTGLVTIGKDDMNTAAVDQILGKIPQADQAWRDVQIKVRGKPVKAGKIADKLGKHINGLTKLRECLG